MVITVRINDEIIYKLCEFETRKFEADSTLLVQAEDLNKIKNDFSKISKLEILKDALLIATYTTYDSISEFSYIGKTFVEGERLFTDSVRVTLTKSNLVSTVEKLEAQINPVYDIDSMTLEELKEYTLGQISIASNADICKGDTINLPSGSAETFTYKDEDQRNLQTAVYCADKVLASGVDVTLVKIPYHSSGCPCKFYDPYSIATIFATLLQRATKIQTYTNAVNMIIREATSKDEVTECYYGMTLPADKQAAVDDIVANSLAMMQIILAPYATNEETHEIDTTETIETENTETIETVETETK